MAFHAISKKFDKPFSNKGKDLVVQFSVKHEGYSYGHCAGGYLKLLPGAGGKDFGGDTKYNIMFGPDMCSYDVSRIHLIFNKGAENLLKKDEIKLEYDDKNEFTHLYTLHLKPDNSAEVFFDQKSKWSGKLSDGWDFPGETIRDPDDPLQVPDPEASQPEDWNEEDDGEYEAPLVDNPSPKMIPNPEYGGEARPLASDFSRWAALLTPMALCSSRRRVHLRLRLRRLRAVDGQQRHDLRQRARDRRPGVRKVLRRQHLGQDQGRREGG